MKKIELNQIQLGDIIQVHYSNDTIVKGKITSLKISDALCIETPFGSIVWMNYVDDGGETFLVHRAEPSELGTCVKGVINDKEFTFIRIRSSENTEYCWWYEDGIGSIARWDQIYNPVVIS